MAKRNWIIDSRDYATEEEFRAAVTDELARAEHSGYRLGFAVVAAPVRQMIDGSVVTLGWEFRAETVPLVREGTPQAGPLPDAPEPEPEESEEHADTADLEPQSADEDEASDFPEPAKVGSDPYAE